MMKLLQTRTLPMAIMAITKGRRGVATAIPSKVGPTSDGQSEKVAW